LKSVITNKFEAGGHGTNPSHFKLLLLTAYYYYYYYYYYFTIITVKSRSRT